jgi:hypothetical protein
MHMDKLTEPTPCPLTEPTGGFPKVLLLSLLFLHLFVGCLL